MLTPRRARDHRVYTPTAWYRKPATVVAAVAAIVVIGAIVNWRRAIAAHAKTQAALHAALNPACLEASELLELVTADRAAGRDQLARERAETALGDEARNFCQAARERLAVLWYLTVLDVQFAPTSPPWYDHEFQLRALEAWQRIEEAADVYGVPAVHRLPHLEVHRRSAGAGQPVLADWAYRQAFRAGEADQVPPRERIEFLTAWGASMTSSPVSAVYEQALVNLATAVEIGRRYVLDADEACRLLQEARPSASCRNTAGFDTTEPLLGASHG